MSASGSVTVGRYTVTADDHSAVVTDDRGGCHASFTGPGANLAAVKYAVRLDEQDRARRASCDGARAA